MCKHFETGTCVQAVANGRCYYKHPDTPASEVDCNLPRSKFGNRTCRNGAKCLYRHNFEMDAEDATLSQMASDDKCARDRTAWDARARRGTHTFDSTLGFPGEGPAKAISWNARGLNDMNKFRQALSSFRRQEADIVLLQEHNWTTARRILAATFNARVKH